MALQRVRRGEPVTVLPSVARTATPTVDEFKIGGGPVAGMVVIIDVTAISATPSVTFTIQGYDPVSAKKWTLLVSTAKTGTGTTVMTVHPALTASANVIAKDVVPNYFSMTAVHGDADSITYSVTAHLL